MGAHRPGEPACRPAKRPPRSQARRAGPRRWPAGAQVRAVDRRATGTSPSATTCTATTSAWTTTSAPTSSGPPRVTLPAPPGPAADLRRLRAQRRPVGHPQLRRHPDLGELLGVDRPPDRRPVPRPRPCDGYPHVDGVVALTHDTGCGLVADQRGRPASRGAPCAGYADHPNIAGLLVLGPGLRDAPGDSPCSTGWTCPPTSPSPRWSSRTPAVSAPPCGPVSRRSTRCSRHSTPCAATRTRLRAGPRPELRRLRRLLGHHRQPRPRRAPPTCSSPHGGTSMLAETPEVFGAEHLLTAPRGRPRGRRRSCSTGSTGGRPTRPPAAAPWTTTRRPATRPAA